MKLIYTIYDFNLIIGILHHTNLHKIKSLYKLILYQKTRFRMMGRLA